MQSDIKEVELQYFKQITKNRDIKKTMDIFKIQARNF